MVCRQRNLLDLDEGRDLVEGILELRNPGLLYHCVPCEHHVAVLDAFTDVGLGVAEEPLAESVDVFVRMGVLADCAGDEAFDAVPVVAEVVDEVVHDGTGGSWSQHAVGMCQRIDSGNDALVHFGVCMVFLGHLGVGHGDELDVLEGVVADQMDAVDDAGDLGIVLHAFDLQSLSCVTRVAAVDGGEGLAVDVLDHAGGERGIGLDASVETVLTVDDAAVLVEDDGLAVEHPATVRHNLGEACHPFLVDAAVRDTEHFGLLEHGGGHCRGNVHQAVLGLFVSFDFSCHGKFLLG